MSKMPVPLTVLRSFELAPENVHVALLLRHSHCTPIEAGTYGNEIELTSEGVRVAEELGTVLGRRQASRLPAYPGLPLNTPVAPPKLK